ncbi:MDR family MFS transporter [Brevibacillus sp. B_LB10_24]|uniref:MDR family MFS transporter n=1 Tax=Brevibacillus sp. B_LB10_24 TaxID=3380645 RepID=UPI0038BC2DE5
MNGLYKLRSFLADFHPIVHSLIVGTVFARAASSMSMPFLAIYLGKHTDMSPVLIGLTIGAGSLAGSVGGFVGGTLSDLFGRKRVMLIALYVWAFVFLGFALGKSTLLFLLLNILSGLCRSIYEPVSQALMADVTEPEKRFRVFSLRYTAINLGVAVGPLLGAALALHGGALPFLVTAFVYFVYAVLLQVLLRCFGIKQIEGQKKERITFRGAWQAIAGDGAFRYFIAGGILAQISYSQMSVTLSQFVSGKFADGIKLFAVLMTVNAITVILLQLPVARWSEKRSPLRSIAVGSVFFALGNIGYAYSSNWWMFIGSMVLFSIGEILCFPASSVFVDRLAPEGMRGTYFGAQSFINVGSFIGPALGGFFLEEYGGSTLFVVVALISLVSIGFYTSGQRRFEASRMQLAAKEELPS